MSEKDLLIRLLTIKNAVDNIIENLNGKPKDRKNNAMAVSKARSRLILDMTTGVVYDSIEKTCEGTGLCRQTIINHCQKRTKWVRFEYMD